MFLKLICSCWHSTLNFPPCFLQKNFLFSKNYWSETSCWFWIANCLIQGHRLIPGEHRRTLFQVRDQSQSRYSTDWETEEENSSTAGRGGEGRASLRFGRYLHSYAKVHHGHTGVPVPAHVHHGVATVRCGLLQRRMQSCCVVLRLCLRRGVLRAFWESREVVRARQGAGGLVRGERSLNTDSVRSSWNQHGSGVSAVFTYCFFLTVNIHKYWCPSTNFVIVQYFFFVYPLTYCYQSACRSAHPMWDHCWFLPSLLPSWCPASTSPSLSAN